MAHQHSSPASSSRHQATRESGDTSAHSTSRQTEPGSLQNLTPTSRSPSPYVSPYAPIPGSSYPLSTVPILRSQRSPSPGASTSGAPSSSGASLAASATRSVAMSSCSSSSQDESVYSTPGPIVYRLPSSAMSSRAVNATERANLIQSLRTHRVNTLIELRRIERTLATTNDPQVAKPMTEAWAYYVHSHNLLNELRSLTRNSFSSECLEEAKNLVMLDAQSLRSWNFCWLVLRKARTTNLIAFHAHQQAAKPAMWGGRTPTAAGVNQLAINLVAEWTRAVDQLLRNWDSPPTINGQ